jgi:protein-disulfide isomerase
MPLTRRTTLSLAGGAVIVAGVAGYAGWRRFGPKPQTFEALAQTAQPATAGSPQAEDAHRAVRSLGDPQAKNTVTEFFSLTCTHCAAFARETMPSVEKDLIQPGKVRFVYHDFPLDQVALTAAMVARYLPPTQYYPFVSALFASQDRWAFARGIDSNEEIWKVAALAGMSRDTFNAAIGDLGLKNWILAQQQRDQNVWKIDSTPSFVIDGKKYAGEMDYDAFRKLLPEA